MTKGTQLTILVVGMARSGTSATAELLASLGLHLPMAADLMQGDESNEHGYFESMSLSVFNERLLNELGGGLTDPPQVEEGWEQDASLEAWRAEARQLFDAAFPIAGVNIWKDPRLSMLLPFWRDVLADHTLAGVLVFRHPTEVVRSLNAHLAAVMEEQFPELVPDGLLGRSLRAFGPSLSMAHGLALWERFTRDALVGLRDLPVFVSPYASLLNDPIRIRRLACTWLGALSRWPPSEQADRILPVEPSLCHQHDASTDDLEASQLILLELLRQLPEMNGRLLPPQLPPVSPRAISVLHDAHLRELQVLQPSLGASA
jgi:hypothetical protein